MEDKDKFILWFNQLGIEDVPLVGGKNASLGEMYRTLTQKGVSIPNGFAITAHSYNYLLDKSGTRDKIRKTLSDLNTKNMHNLAERGREVRDTIVHAEFPEDLKNIIFAAYDKLCKEYGKNCDVAVRSSATAEDLPDASFAGQQETYLNIRGHNELLIACKKCFASLFTNRAISYRVDKGFDHFSIGLSIGVQKMVRSDRACSGVMFSLDTESGFDKVVLINAAYGLGETVVQGAVNPDEFYVFKPTLKTGFDSIISRKLGDKAIKMIYSSDSAKPTKTIHTPLEDTKRFCLTDKEVLTLARWACQIEDHYTAKRGKYTPMDMEWAKDGETNKLFIVQARPETVHSQKKHNMFTKYNLSKKGKILIKGHSVGQKIGSGIAHVIKDVHDISKFRKGEVLVTDMTDPDWEPIMKIASAIVTNRGGRTCHAAIISRELGIPCIVGTNTGTTALKDAYLVTVDCSEGDEGIVYKGALRFDIEEHNLEHLPKTKTKILVNIGNPEEAFEHSFLPVNGVGLAREEFIINSYIKVHPKALIHFDSLKDHKVRAEIQSITEGYADKKKFFVDKLAEGVSRIAAAFYPNPVIVRLSDFKTNEYANLVGGTDFEPKEENPMIGWRGASRYYDPKYSDAFALECKGLKKAREELGLRNIKILIPFCRTVEEGKSVLAEMKKNGLIRGRDGLEVYVMCEIPSNVILADEFLDIFDGMSIGSNDLTQCTLGLDRDSGILAHIGNEKNEAVKKLVKQVILVANKRGKYIGICGDAPSTYADFAEFLVENHIQSISLSPDAVIKTVLIVGKIEKKMGR